MKGATDVSGAPALCSLGAVRDADQGVTVCVGLEGAQDFEAKLDAPSAEDTEGSMSTSFDPDARSTITCGDASG